MRKVDGLVMAKKAIENMDFTPCIYFHILILNISPVSLATLLSQQLCHLCCQPLTTDGDKLKDFSLYVL